MQRESDPVGDVGGSSLAAAAAGGSLSGRDGLLDSLQMSKAGDDKLSAANFLAKVVRFGFGTGNIFLCFGTGGGASKGMGNSFVLMLLDVAPGRLGCLHRLPKMDAHVLS